MTAILLVLMWNWLAPSMIWRYLDNDVVLLVGNLSVTTLSAALAAWFLWRGTSRWQRVEGMLCALVSLACLCDVSMSKSRTLRVQAWTDGPIHRAHEPTGDGVYVQVRISNQGMLPRSMRILNCGWHGCVGISPPWLRIYSTEGCDATWWNDYTVTIFHHLQKRMGVWANTDADRGKEQRPLLILPKVQMPPTVLATISVWEPDMGVYGEGLRHWGDIVWSTYSTDQPLRINTVWLYGQ